LRLLCHIIEAGFPAFYIASSAFGGNEQCKFFASIENFGDLGDGILFLSTVNGNTTHPTHKTAKRGTEKGVLAEKRKINAGTEGEHQKEYKIPIA